MVRSHIFGIALVVGLTVVSAVSAQVRLKDVAFVKDQKEITLTGYGLVTGLNGSGDGKNTQFTVRMVGNLMKNMGLEVPSTSIKVKNVAAVMVTATVSPYVKVGGAFDVNVSSIGDAKSIEGGNLVASLLYDGEMNICATAQGPVSIGGANKDYSGEGGIIQNAVLSGVVSGGGTLERSLPTIGMDEKSLAISLREPDYTTAYRLSDAINEYFTEDIAVARDAGGIIVEVPDEYAEQHDIVRFISELESISFNPDVTARVVINERTGTVIAGSNVSLAPVAIMHGTLSLMIQEEDTALAQGAAQNVQGRNGDRLVSFGESVDVGEIARSLNLLGVTPRDMIAIFQALKAAGSLRAELVVM